jgi:hypothetical protein
VGAPRAGGRQIHQIRHIRTDNGVDQRDLVTDLTAAGPITHEPLVRAGEPRAQRRRVIEVDTHDLDLGSPQGSPGRLGVAGKDPHLLAGTHQRLSQGLTDKSGTTGNSNHVEASFVSECRSDSRRPQARG